MPSKGMELPVNSVIVIALAIFVLLMMAAFFGKSSGELSSTQINTAFNQGCSQLASTYNCDYTKVDDVATSLVINGQAKTLLDVCRMSFNDPSRSAFKCKFSCQVCPKMIYEGSMCEIVSGSDPNEHCKSPLTSDWTCTTGGCRHDISTPPEVNPGVYGG